MIELNVEPLCHNCKTFDANTNTAVMYAEGEPYIVTHEITCRNKDICNNIRAAIKAAEEHEV